LAGTAGFFGDNREEMGRSEECRKAPEPCEFRIGIERLGRKGGGCLDRLSPSRRRGQRLTLRLRGYRQGLWPDCVRTYKF